MSRNRRGWEEPASPHWQPGYRHSYSDGHAWRHYALPTEFLPRGSFNYWRDTDDLVAPTSRSYGREGYGERWHDDSRSRHADASFSRWRRDAEPGRDWEDRESRAGRDRSSPHRNPSHQRYSTYTPPYNPLPVIRAGVPTESTLPIPKHAPPDPPRKASPPPNMPSQPPKPSLEYLSLSQDPSQVLRDPAMTRKLLVLDLNGTLLIRSARSRTTSGPQLRPVQPRPYMQSFRQYLFCPETKAWLDTMVWSSAQPHSVDDMVDKVFGSAKGELKAIWNRKSLGLSEADYHRKTITTKDLAKPWDLFTSALSPEKLHEHSAISSQPHTIHSALTTLLLDDSPHKAVLQPYSHVCIPEYDSARRQHDLRSFLATKEPRNNRKAKRENQVEKTVHSTAQMIPEPLLPDGLTESAEKEPYDVILLAIIGILEAVKLQSNVAGWIREGGLWAAQGREEGGALDVKHRCIVQTQGGTTVSNALVRNGKDASDTSAYVQKKMWFDDSSIVTFWVAQGRRTLMELGIQIAHGVTG